MKFLKEKKGIIISFIIGVILASSIAVYASISASEVDYKNGQKVSQALDDLYSKVPSGTKTITTKESNIDVSKYQYADTTGLYTLSEVQSGKGTSWDTGTTNMTNGNCTIDLKDLNFTPSKVIVYYYNNTTKYYGCFILFGTSGEGFFAWYNGSYDYSRCKLWDSSSDGEYWKYSNKKYICTGWGTTTATIEWYAVK